jgi:two-component sensor histidine kinase
MAEQLLSRGFQLRGWPWWARYGASAILVIIALELHLLLASTLAAYPFILFFPAVMIAALVFDRGSGLFATALSAALAAYFLLEPIGSLRVRETDFIALILFVLTSAMAAVIIEALHSAVYKLILANERLAAAEQEKDFLLREAGHRFKNDLAILAALVRLQERSMEDPEARAALASTADRIQVVGRVQERLTLADSQAVVDTREFICELCDDLKAALLGVRSLVLKVEAERHLLQQDRCVAVGLVLNELLANALKHAFPDDQAGNVAVRAAREGESYCLTVSDDGAGMSPERRSKQPGLGGRLMRSLAAQLGGTMTVARANDGPGTMARLCFPAEA